MTGNNSFTVDSVMTNRYIELDGLVTVYDALQEMKQKDVNVVIIAKRDPSDEYGVVVLSDIAKKVLAKDRSPKRVNIYEIMSKPVISIHPKMKVKYCAQLFLQFGISIAPVLDNGEIIGVVSYRALVLRGLLEMSHD